MKNYPKISIITPSFNQGHFIEETILSVFNQNYPNLEYIIIDGGSTDETINIIRKYEHKINYWISEPDEGQSHAINKGFKRATGEIISWLNSDDILEENGLASILNGFNKYREADFIYGQSIHLNRKGKKEVFYPPNYPNLRLEYLGSFPYIQPACFYKKQILDEIGFIDESFHYTMDFDFFVRIALNYKIQYIDLPIACFREQEHAKTNQYNDNWDYERKRVINRLINSLQLSNSIDIQHLKNLKIYVEENVSYPVSIEISNEEIIKIIAIFIRDSIKMNFHAQKFKESYSISKKMKKWLPKYFDKEMDFLHRRSKIYQFKFLFLLIRPLALLKKQKS
jgi:glycosyltransferase involved in cell wall biosynthesis